MQTRDPQILRLIERIGEHYRTNIANRFLRPALFQLALDKASWDQIETLTEKMEQFRYQGFQFDELYRQIDAAARFVYIARNSLISIIKFRISDNSSGQDKVFRDMAINNFGPNLKYFAGLVNELYENLTDLDKAASRGQKPVYTQIPELGDIGRRLAGD